MSLTTKQINKIKSFYNVELTSHLRLLINERVIFQAPKTPDIWLTFGKKSLLDKTPSDFDNTEDFIAYRDNVFSRVDGPIKCNYQILVESLYPDRLDDLTKHLAEQNRQTKAIKDADKMCADAFGAVEYAISTSMDNDASDLAKKYGFDWDADMPVTLDGGLFGSTVLVGQSIDDYEVIAIITKTKREDHEIIDFYRTLNDLYKILRHHHYDLNDTKFTSWETGIESNFWDILVDNSNPWQELTDRIEYFLDSYAGD